MLQSEQTEVSLSAKKPAPIMHKGSVLATFQTWKKLQQEVHLNKLISTSVSELKPCPRCATASSISSQYRVLLAPFLTTSVLAVSAAAVNADVSSG